MMFKPQEKLADPLESSAAEVAQWLPIYEIDSSTDPFYPLMRFYIFLTINIGRLKESDRTFDVEPNSRRSIRSLVTFCEFMFTLVTHAVTKRDSHSGYQLIDPSLGVSWFKNTKVDPNLVLEVFNSVGFTLESPVAGTKRIGYADFEPLKRTPYFFSKMRSTAWITTLPGKAGEQFAVGSTGVNVEREGQRISGILGLCFRGLRGMDVRNICPSQEECRLQISCL